VLSFSGDAAANVVEIRSLNHGLDNTIQYDLGTGFVSQSGVTAISYQDGGGNDTLLFGGNSTLAGLRIDSNVNVQLTGTLLATAELVVAARAIDSRATIVGPSVELLGHYGFDMHSGMIQSPGGTIRVGTSAEGTTSITGSLNTSTESGSGEAGGTIHVQGKSVRLAKARLSANGDTRGGTVLVGGGLHGQGPFASAERTIVAGYSSISASALNSGDGGVVVIWSDRSTSISHAFLYAQGGLQSGNGGLIETSGRQTLSIVNVPVSANSPHGLPGTWLLDPLNVTIDNLPTANINPGVIFTPTAAGAVLNAAFVETTLSNGTNVSVASSGGAGAEAGDINVNVVLTRTNLSPVVPTLTLNAFHDVNVSQAIQGSAGAPLNIVLMSGASGTVNVAAALDTFGGSLQSSGASFASTAAGHITASTIDISQTASIDIAGDLTATSSISIHAGTAPAGGNLVFSGTPSLNSPAIDLQAGPAGATASNILIGAATFHGAAGGATSPLSFGYRQDAAILDTALPAAAQFGAAIPGLYSVTSDGGTISLTSPATAGQLLGSQLMLSGTSTSISVPLTLVSLEVTHGVSLGVSGPPAAVTTTSFQLYHDPVTLAADTLLESTGGGEIKFESTIDSSAVARGLTINTSGNEVFQGRVGTAGPHLTYLRIDTNLGPGLGSGTTIFDVPGSTVMPNVRTTLEQNYNDAVELRQDSVLTAGGGLLFAKAIGTTGLVDLTLRGGGTTILGGGLTGVDALASDNGNATVINAPISATSVEFDDVVTLNVASPLAAVATSGFQLYKAAITLAADTILTDSSSGNITFQSTINSDIVASDWEWVRPFSTWRVRWPRPTSGRPRIKPITTPSSYDKTPCSGPMAR
jgi:hypothetical protein